jgi:hypothetical protein
MKYCLTFILLLFTATLTANDSLFISRLLQRINYLQPKTDGVFPGGSMPSYRLYALNKDRYKADINPFFTGLVTFGLQDIMPELSPAQQRQADTIITRALPVYSKFRNRQGRNTYNFWPTDTPQIFPHSGWLNLFDKSRALADDMDDTVIMLMAQRARDSAAKGIHALMQQFANGRKNKVRNTFAEYKNTEAYSTWFGEKMPVDFDVCVLANVLYFVQLYDLEWTKADSASLYLIRDIIEQKRHVSAPRTVAPHYAALPVILYHVSRLMALKPIPSLEKLKPQLIEEAKQAFASARSFMDEVILGTSLLRWGVAPPEGIIHKTRTVEELVEEERFTFFLANMTNLLPDPFKQWGNASGLGRFYYYCPAYNNFLLIENLVWRKRRGI